MITNILNLPQPFVDAVTSDYAYTPKRYSVTALIKGTKAAVLDHRHADEIDIEVADQVWMIFGRAVHKILEESQETDTQIKENKIVVDLPDGYSLSGIFDLYDDATGIVTDYKTASVWKIQFREFDDWRMQTLLYVWLLRQIGFKNARHGQIVATLKDHSKTKAKFDAGYPQFPVYTIGWDFTDDDLAVADAFITAKFKAIAEAEALPDDEIPICTPEERWHKDDTWAVKKRGAKRAVKVYHCEQDAMERAASDGLEVEFRPGEDTRCMNYCQCNKFCNHYRELMK